MHINLDDPLLVDKIVSEVKSQGVFDQFRKDCMSDVDTKPAYQNLRQRVEISVGKFLSEQFWTPETNKIQLREKLRKYIAEAGFLETGVERIVDQVVNPKITTVFQPKIEDIAYKYLGIEKPQEKFEDISAAESSTSSSSNICANGLNLPKTNAFNLMPNDLEAVSSPDSDKINALKRSNSSNSTISTEDFEKDNDNRNNYDTNHVSNAVKKEEKDSNYGYDDEKLGENDVDDDDDESPPFEPLEGRPPSPIEKDNNNESQLSGISGLTSQESIESIKPDKKELDDCQLSQVSSSSQLSMITAEDNEEDIKETKPIAIPQQTKLENDLSEEAQMPKFFEDSVKTESQPLHFDIKKDEIKFEGTERRSSIQNLSNEEKINQSPIQIPPPVPAIIVEAQQTESISRNSFELINSPTNSDNDSERALKIMTDVSQSNSLVSPVVSETANNKQQSDKIDETNECTHDDNKSLASSSVQSKSQESLNTSNDTDKKDEPTIETTSIEKDDKKEKYNRNDRNQHRHSSKKKSKSSKDEKSRSASTSSSRNSNSHGSSHHKDHHRSQPSSSNHKDRHHHKSKSSHKKSSSSNNKSDRHEKDRKHSHHDKDKKHRDKDRKSGDKITDDHFSVKNKTNRRKSTDSNDGGGKGDNLKYEQKIITGNSSMESTSATTSTTTTTNTTTSGTTASTSKSSSISPNLKSKLFNYTSDTINNNNSNLKPVILDNLLNNNNFEDIELAIGYTTISKANFIQVHHQNPKPQPIENDDFHGFLYNSYDEQQFQMEIKILSDKLNDNKEKTIFVNCDMKFKNAFKNLGKIIEIDFEKVISQSNDKLLKKENSNKSKSITVNGKTEIHQQKDRRKRKRSINDNVNQYKVEETNEIIINNSNNKNIEVQMNKKFKKSELQPSSSSTLSSSTVTTDSDSVIELKENDCLPTTTALHSDVINDETTATVVIVKSTTSTKNNQRYSSEDLYKPRPILSQRSKRRGLDACNF